MLKSYDDLRRMLNDKGIAYRADVPESAVEIPSRIREADGRIIVLWDPRATLLHVIRPLGFTVVTARVPAFLDALARVNHSLVLPGFGFNHGDSTAYFRWVVPRHTEGGLTEEDVNRAISTVIDSVRDFHPALQAVATGESKPEDVLAVALATKATAPES